MTPPATAPAANNLEAFFMPFTANRQFKKNPRLLAKAKGVHYWTPEGRKIIDGTAGLWCVNAGHGREEIKAAIAQQLEEMDYAPSFQMGHPKSFELAARHAALLPGDLNHAFYCNSGSEAVDSRAQDRARLSPRQRPGHAHPLRSAASAAITASASAASRSAAWSTTASGSARMLPGVDHLPHTHLPPERLLARASPSMAASSSPMSWKRIVGLHDASNIAAVIVEPCAGSTGYLPPPKGYLQRLRQICDKHGILLIFDEVITGFGRLGTGFAADKFGVIPDLMTVAKGISNATVPMGGVFVRKHVFDGLMNGPENVDRPVPRLHLLGPSAGLRRGLGRARHLQGRGRCSSARPSSRTYWEEGVHSLKGLPDVTDIRNLGLAAGIDLEPQGAVGTRGFDAFAKAFELGLMVRQSGDAIAMSPPLVIEKAQIDEIIDITAKTIKAVAVVFFGEEPAIPTACSSTWSAHADRPGWPRWRMSPSRAA